MAEKSLAEVLDEGVNKGWDGTVSFARPQRRDDNFYISLSPETHQAFMRMLERHYNG